MPAKDKYHDKVVTALKKDGWTITNEQVRLVIGDRWLWIDIQAEKFSEQLTILIEVKGFENLKSPMAYLQSVVGQFIIYRTVLDYLEWEYPLYLALPETIEDDILKETVGQEIIKSIGLKMIRFSVSEEKITQWIT